MQKKRGRGRPRIYKDDAEKTRVYQEKKKIQKMCVDLPETAKYNRAFFQKAAAAMNMTLSEMIVTSCLKWIYDHLGSEWVEENKNKSQHNGGE